MKYRATIEIEFEAEGDPLDALHRVILAPIDSVVDYRVIEQPKARVIDPRAKLRTEVLSFYTGHYGETPTDEHLTRICELIEEERGAR